MPFGSLNMPSLGLTQIESVLKTRFPESVEVSTHYLNFDFARYLGDVEQYNKALSGAGFMTGIGDWFFRQSAFPDASDNTSEYFARFYFDDDPQTKAIRHLVEQKRPGLDDFLDQLIEKYRLAEADIVGFTALFSQAVASFAMARRLKKKNPGIIAVLGGSACEGLVGRTVARHIEQIDYVFSGPGLVSFPRFVQNCLDGKMEDSARIKGVFPGMRRLSSPISGDGITGEDLDINANVMLDYKPFLDSMDLAFPGREVKPVLLFETSRGCRWAEKVPCSFCGLNGMHIRYCSMAPENAVCQLQSLFKWVPRCPYFIGVDTIVPANYLKEVFPCIHPPAGMRMLYEVRPDLAEDDIKTLCNAGITVIQPGIEALSTQALQLMRKGTTAPGNVRFLKNCVKHPIKLEWNLLIYSPGEKEEVYRKYLQDIPLLMHLPPPTAAYPVGFVRYSHYFENAARYGLNLVPQDFYGLTYPFDAATIADIAYHFVDRNADTERIDYWLDALNGKIALWRTRWANSDGKLESQLCMRQHRGMWTIYDSRTGEAVEYKISDEAREVLNYLSKPASRTDIAGKFAGAGFDTDLQIAWTKEHGLLFEEDGRFISLVIS